MPLVIKDRIKETTTTTGVGTITLLGAESKFLPFSEVGDGNSTLYAIVHRTADEWEVREGVYTASGTTLTRGTLFASSTGSAVDFSAGTKDVFVTVPANKMVGKHSVFVPAAGMFSRITGGAEYSQTETGTNRVQRAGFLFDGSTQEHVQFYLGAPKGWNKGTVVARFVYCPTTTSSTAARWEIAGRAFGDGDDLEAAFGTAVGVDTSHTTAYRVEVSGSTAAMTIAGTPATDDMLVFQVSRDPANAGDTYTADALLLGVWLDFTYDALTDE